MPSPGVFVHVETISRAEIVWFWTHEKLHDTAHHIRVNDAISTAVETVESKFGVTRDSRFCCQWEGVAIEGKNLSEVTAAAHEIGRTLSRFSGVVPCL